MDTVEVVDDSVMPWFDVDCAQWLSHRPITTEADLIAAALPIGEVEIRSMVDVLADDSYEGVHARGRCSICAPGNDEYVLQEKRLNTEEMTEFGVGWDPTITF